MKEETMNACANTGFLRSAGCMNLFSYCPSGYKYSKTGMKIGTRSIILALLVCCTSISSSLHAQQIPNYSQYRMNEFLFNPATAGVDGYSTAGLIAREQMMGIEGAPRTHAISIQSRLLPNSFIFKGLQIRKKRGWASRDGRIGVGAFIYNDHAGLLDRTGLQLTYSYHIRLNDAQLSFGLSANFYQLRIQTDPGKIILADDDGSDGVINGSKRSTFIPDVNFGAFYMTSQYYAGFSATDLSQSSLKLGGYDNSEFKTNRQYVLIAGYKIRLDKEIILEPNTLIRINEIGKIQGDLGAKALFNDQYWGGLAYRTPNTLIALGGIKVNKFYFGYAFDFSFASIQRYSFGTHEFMLAYKFGETARRYRWLNEF
jgi:type IX secretion system PorP/SprF family membrane protein